MCLAAPMKLIAVNGRVGAAELYGLRQEVRLDLMEAPKPGEYYLIHAGFAIQKISEEEALATLASVEM